MVFEDFPCPFGQAYVKLNSSLDRDNLVNQSPHLFGDVHIIFHKHNQGLNWRTWRSNLGFLVGFPLDKEEEAEDLDLPGWGTRPCMSII